METKLVLPCERWKRGFSNTGQNVETKSLFLTPLVSMIIKRETIAEFERRAAAGEFRLYDTSSHRGRL
jgi:hypothetical protein